MNAVPHSASRPVTVSPFGAALTDVLHRFDIQAADRSQSVAWALANPVFNVQALGDYLLPPGPHPYGRRLVFQNEHIELIVMNWGAHSLSLPHDHGQSEGWVRVLCGAARHGRYVTDDDQLQCVEELRYAAGTIFHAPVGLVHHMGNPSDEPLVTLHCYFPPIHRMEVFDVATSRAAIVSDDCGAWWPTRDGQIVETREFGMDDADTELARGIHVD